jgi:ribosome maturation factor RimP
LFAVARATKIEDVERTLAAVLPEVEVVDVEVAGGRGKPVLRVFIDHPDGVNHELCAQVTGLLDHYLQDHTVEVSSPGLEKRLRKPEHYRAAVGQKINIKTFGPVEGQRNFTGFLFSAGDEALTLELESGKRVTIPLDAVAGARTVFEFGGQEKPSGKRRQKRD